MPSLRSWSTRQIYLLARVVEKFLASVIAAVSVAMMYLVLRRFAARRAALIFASVFAFATNTWTTSSQALWQHGISQFALLVALWALTASVRDHSAWWVDASFAVAAALSAAFRPTDVLFIASCCVVLAWKRRWRALSALLIASAIVGGSLVWYNVFIFGSIRGSADYSRALNGDIVAGMAGLLVSPSRGLFVYSPILLFIFPALWRWLRMQPNQASMAYWISALFVVAHTCVLAEWPMWWGGNCFGPRMMVDVLPAMVLLLAAEWPGYLGDYKLLRGLFAVLLILSTGVQLIGALSYPLGERFSGGRGEEPLWSFRDTPITRSVKAGVDTRGLSRLWRNPD